VYPDFALRTAGGDVRVAAPWQSYVLQDRELISGQNLFSDQTLLKLLLTALSAKKNSRQERSNQNQGVQQKLAIGSQQFRFIHPFDRKA
jgi:hypothetical protein